MRGKARARLGSYVYHIIERDQEGIIFPFSQVQADRTHGINRLIDCVTAGIKWN